MEELEAVAEVFGLENFGRSQQFGRAQPEFCVFAAAFSPLAGAFAQQARADANDRLDADLARDVNDVSKLFELLNDHDDLLAELDAEESHFDEARVFVAVADDHSTGLIQQRE